tara:strand:+ start:108707 stop:109168 length:462 start_codon:yes stop_codon:yes gene_type:complete
MNNTTNNTDENSFLEGLKPTDGMKVPAGYFDRFENELKTKINASSTEVEVQEIRPRSKSSTLKMVSILAVAASVLSAVFYFNASSEIPNEEPKFSLQSDDLDYYDVDEYLLAENFTEEEMDAISFTDDYLTSDEIIDYILNENYSEYTITENL